MTAIKTGRSPVSGWNSFVIRPSVVQTRWLAILTDESHEKLNPLNAELNPICHLMALLGAHHIFHVSRIRVKRMVYKTTQIQLPSTTLQFTVL